MNMMRSSRLFYGRRKRFDDFRSSVQLLKKRPARTNSHWTCCPQMKPRSAYRRYTGGIYRVAVTGSKAVRGTDQLHTLVRWVAEDPQFCMNNKGPRPRAGVPSLRRCVGSRTIRGLYGPRGLGRGLALGTRSFPFVGRGGSESNLGPSLLERPFGLVSNRVKQN
jgi:hypothetical protein